jgi:hypothetical protein
VTGVTVVGVRGHLVAVEAHVGGLPSLTLTGLSGVGVQDARDRSSVTDPAVLRVLLKVREGGRGLLVGNVRRLRRLLAGSALRRERQVTRHGRASR